MTKGTTKSGFEFEYDEEKVADDWELIDLLADITEDSEKAIFLPKIAKKILGMEQYNRFVNFYRDENGIAKMTVLTPAIWEIINTKPTKN